MRLLSIMRRLAKRRKFYGRDKGKFSRTIIAFILTSYYPNIDFGPSTKIGAALAHSNSLTALSTRVRSRTRRVNIFSMEEVKGLMSMEVATGAIGKMVKPTARES